LAAGCLVEGIADYVRHSKYEPEVLRAPRTGFAAGLRQLPMTIGIVAFNAMTFPRGIALAIGMLVLHLGVVLKPRDLRRMLGPSAD